MTIAAKTITFAGYNWTVKSGRQLARGLND
jgi:hypothetical protein